MAEELEVAVDPNETVSAGGIILPNYQGAADHAADLARYFGGLAKVEKRFPTLIAFTFKLSHAIKAWADEKNVAVRALKCGDTFWTPNGDVAFDLEHDPYDLTPNKDHGYLKSGYARLPLMAEDYPCLVNFVDAMNYQLSLLVDAGRVVGSHIRFTGLHFFENKVSRRPAWGFRMYDSVRKRALKPETRVGI